MSNERFFVRSHFPIPKVDAADWSLTVSGEVENQLTIGYADLKELPRHEVLALLECAGNSRAAVQPPIEGLLWDHGGGGTSGMSFVVVGKLVYELARERGLGTEIPTNLFLQDVRN